MPRAAKISVLPRMAGSSWRRSARSCAGSIRVPPCPRVFRSAASARYSRLKETTVARVTMIKPEQADAETREVYDGVLKQWGRISNFSQVLAHQPAALAGWMLPNEAIRLSNVKAASAYVKIQQLVITKTLPPNR